MFEWNVEQVNYNMLESRLNELSAEGYEIEKLEMSTHDTTNWFIVAVKVKSPTAERLDDVVERILEDTEPMSPIDDYVGDTE